MQPYILQTFDKFRWSYSAICENAQGDDASFFNFSWNI